MTYCRKLFYAPLGGCIARPVFSGKLLSKTCNFVSRLKTTHVCSFSASTSAARQLDGLSKLGIRKRHSKFTRVFIEVIQPLLPFIKNWTLIDKIFTTLWNLCIIRCLYFCPILGINHQTIPSNIQLSSPDQAMLAELFMAHDSIPLNFALLGISPLIVSSFFVQMIINVPVFQFMPGPFQDVISKHRMGTLTRKDVDAFSFNVALIFGAMMALRYALLLEPFASGGWFFMIFTISGMLAALSITHHCCEDIQRRGFGEGTGSLILALTMSGFAKKIYSIGKTASQGLVPFWKIGIILLLYVLIVSGCALFHEIHLRLPLTEYGMKNEYKIMSSKIPTVLATHIQKQQPSSVARNPYFPISVSQTAVTAVFLSSAVLTILSNLVRKLFGGVELLKSGPLSILLLGVIAFCLSLLPIGGQSALNVTEHLAGFEVGIKGAIPGEQSVELLRKKMFQTQLFGASCLFFIVISCLSLDSLCAIWIGTPIGSLNLVLLVAVLSAGFKTMETHLQTIRIDNILQKEKQVIALSQETKI